MSILTMWTKFSLSLSQFNFISFFLDLHLFIACQSHYSNENNAFPAQTPPLKGGVLAGNALFL